MNEPEPHCEEKGMIPISRHPRAALSLFLLQLLNVMWREIYRNGNHPGVLDAKFLKDADRAAKRQMINRSD